MEIIRIIFLFFLALIPSVYLGFVSYIFSYSLFPIIHNRFIAVIVLPLVMFVVLFLLLVVFVKRKSRIQTQITPRQDTSAGLDLGKCLRDTKEFPELQGQNRKKISVLIWVSALILGVIVASVFGYHEYIQIDYGYTPIDFSHEKWKTASEEQRGYMYSDLLTKHNLEGLTFEEIDNLFGKPDSKCYDEKTKLLYSYMYKIGYVGLNPKAFLVFPHCLYILFDKKGSVKEYDILSSNRYLYLTTGQ